MHVVSVVDTAKGYWHIELDHESGPLCTFHTKGQFLRDELLQSALARHVSGGVAHSVVDIWCIVYTMFQCPMSCLAKIPHLCLAQGTLIYAM